MTTPNPFLTIDQETAGPVPDALDAWRETHASMDANDLYDAGERLARHVVSLRTWVEHLEREAAELRGLVERATEGDWGEHGHEWAEEARAVLAGETYRGHKWVWRASDGEWVCSECGWVSGIHAEAADADRVLAGDEQGGESA